MPTPIIAPLSRGESGVAEFFTSQESDLKISYITVNTLADRDAIPIWKRLPYMTVNVVADGTVENNKEYTLGASINTPIWYVKTYGIPDNIVVEDDIFDVNGFIKPQLIGNIFLNTSYVVDDEAEMLALTTLTGNFIIRTDDSNIYVKLNNTNPASIGDFATTSNPGTVLTINGETGVVVLTIENLLAYGVNQNQFETAVENSLIVTEHTALLAELELNKITATYADSHIGSKIVTSLLQNPTDVNDGWTIAWDKSINRYTLSATAGGGEGPQDTDELDEGDVNFYFTEPRVLATLLTGLDVSPPVLEYLEATDTLIQALGKVQRNTELFDQTKLANNGANSMVSNLPMGGYKLVNLANATETGNAVTYDQWLSALDGVKVKDDVIAATTVDITLANEQTIDDIAVVAGNRVLVKDQADQVENGIYLVVSGGAWTRTTDSDSGIELQSALVKVDSGTINIGTSWLQATTDVTVDGTNLVWVQFGSTVPNATDTTRGILKLYNTSGTAIDGTMTQDAITTAIANATIDDASPTVAGKAKLYGSLGSNTDGSINQDVITDTFALYLPLTGGTLSGALALGGNKITGIAAGNTTGEAVTYEQLLSFLDGLAWKKDAVVATTTDITLSGLQTIDGIPVVVNDRVLVKDQSVEIDNGVYLAAVGTWTRTSDTNTSIELQSAAISVSMGTVNADTAWSQTSDNITLGVDDIIWTQLGASVPDATPTTKGKMKLYTVSGVNTDGTMDQNSITLALAAKQNSLGYTAENQANKENTTLDTSTTKYPTNRLAKEYIDAKIDDTAYAGSWDGVTTIAPSKNAVYDKIQTLISPSINPKGVSFDGGGNIVLVNTKIYFRMPTSGTFSAWTIEAEGTSPTCTIDIWKVATGTALPTVGDSIIGAGTKPALATGNALRSTTFTSWTTTSFSANDIFCINIFACSAATKITFQWEL